MSSNTMTNLHNNPVRGATKTRTMVQIAMLGGLAAVLMLFEFPMPFLAPSFYELDFSEVPVLIGSFAMGPLAGACIELIKILINLVLNGTNTMFVGELANLLMGCALVVPAGFVYKKHKTKKYARVSLLMGTIFMTIAATFLNAYVLLPVYGKAFGMSMDVIIGAGAAVNKSIDSLFKFCLLAVAPFNIVKGVLVSAITLLLYKHISRLLKGQNL
ncbi:ECF transporter S component [Novisyntrophococcus fermenticellae]|uniref:ECF transporter S component n=1 Tax=Novisyntrophococcus fermenticellae TaxID=2068655 RepID=UPI001E4C127B|nr:ECF transporter S component [Novisyntrophococcus fermenticellae]